MVNEAPTKEFNISIGVRQGDPLAPFLFIIAMEELHVSMEVDCELHYFRGLTFDSNDVPISHLMYDNNVVFVGEWSEINFVNLNRLLRCFFLASGLKVNLNKSKVLEWVLKVWRFIGLLAFLIVSPLPFRLFILGFRLGQI